MCIWGLGWPFWNIHIAFIKLLQKFKIVVNITKEKSVLFLTHTVVQNSQICHLQNCCYYCSFANISCVWRDACIFKSCAPLSHTLKHLQSSIKLFLGGPWFNYITRLYFFLIYQSFELCDACISDGLFYFEGLFWDRVSLYNLGCPGTYSIDQAGLKLKEIHLPPPPKCWD